LITLEVCIKDAGYGKKLVLSDVRLSATDAELISIVGPNGAGKSTLLKALMGLVRVREGSVTLNGEAITNIDPEQAARRGLSYVPQRGAVFNDLSVLENLEVGGHLLADYKQVHARAREVIALFPILTAHLSKRASMLSGGEKQQLALARALMVQPKLLLLDEPSLGLAPALVRQVFTAIRQLNRALGVPILIVEQKVSEVLRISDRVYALRMGRTVFAGPPQEFMSTDAARRVFLS